MTHDHHVECSIGRLVLRGPQEHIRTIIVVTRLTAEWVKVTWVNADPVRPYVMSMDLSAKGPPPSGTAGVPDLVGHTVTTVKHWGEV